MNMYQKRLLNFTFLFGVMVVLCMCTRNAYAFNCTSNGVSIGGSGTYTVPVDIVLNKSTTEIELTNLNTYTSCSGYLGWAGQGGPAANDALRTYGSSSFSSALTAIGFRGYAILPNGRFNFPLPTGQCIWPDGNCTYTSGTNLTTSPVNIRIGMTKISTDTSSGSTIPAGTEIARFTLEQRGTVGGAPPTWGNGIKTWVFTLKKPLVIPSYTCTWTNPNQTVQLPSVNRVDIIRNGMGRYPEGKDFSINLNCDPQTTVSVQFDGSLMSGKNDVLANTASGNNAVGVQVTYQGAAIIFGQKIQVISNASTQESLKFNAYYYYNGGDLSAGNLNAVSTVTLTYN